MQTLFHCPLWHTSTRPSNRFCPPVRRMVFTSHALIQERVPWHCMRYSYWNGYSPLDSSGRKIRIAKHHDKKLKAMLASCVNSYNVTLYKLHGESRHTLANSVRMRIPIPCRREVGVARSRRVKSIQAVVNRACKLKANTYSFPKAQKLFPSSTMAPLEKVRVDCSTCARSVWAVTILSTPTGGPVHHVEKNLQRMVNNAWPVG
jgi:hypothetical protein